MPGPEPPRRKRFQIHLSTAIVMMFVAGGIIWANRIPRIEKVFNPFTGGMMSVEMWCYGWPIESYGEIVDSTTQLHLRTVGSLMSVAFDLTVAICILLAVYIVCEWLIRLRAARKGA
jgi:hypothetical protein